MSLATDAFAPGPARRYRVPADSIVLLSQWVTHRDARFFPDRLRFDPPRLTPEAAASRPAVP
jgi:cytochrome P450